MAMIVGNNRKIMRIPNLTIQQFRSRCTLGSQNFEMEPKNEKYIFGKRDSIHIIDLTQTIELTKQA